MSRLYVMRSLICEMSPRANRPYSVTVEKLKNGDWSVINLNVY